MKIETTKDIQQQTLVVNNVLSIELRQEGDGPVEIRLIPHYENAVYFIVQNFGAEFLHIPLPEANLAVLNYILEGKMVHP